MHSESFFNIKFYIFDKWRKTVQKNIKQNINGKNINALRRWSTDASKVDGKRSCSNSFW